MLTQNNEYLGTEKIYKLMMKFSIPSIIALLVSAFYNIVDQVFIGWGVGALGIGATNVIFPITIFALAIAIMIGDGAAAFLSISQGENNQSNIHHCIGNAIVLLIAYSTLMVILTFIFKDSVLHLFGATENILPYADKYFDIIVLGLPCFIIGIGLNAVIRADGNPKFAMLATLLGCIINIILDPIAIFVLKWGMQGAAIATVVGQLASAVVMGVYMVHLKSAKLKKDSFVLERGVVGKILGMGVSSFLTQISAVIFLAVINPTLVKYGELSKYGMDVPITVIGVVIKFFQIVVAVIIGLAVGCQPIIGYNYGAGKLTRVKKLYRNILFAELAFCLFATILIECFPLQIFGLFGIDGALYNEYASYAFRIYLCSMVLTAVVKSSSSFLQAIDKPIMAMIIVLLRDVVFSCSFTLILAHFYGVLGPLWSAPLADILTVLVVAVIMCYVFKRYLNRPNAV